MAKAPAKGRKAKVYWAEIDGLNEWIVAAPNRPEALQAFGVNQDLFGQGAAGEEADPDKTEAARACPGVPLRRPKGSQAAFAPVGGTSDWSAAIPQGSRPNGKRKPDRKALDRAEARRYEAARTEAGAAREEAAKAFESAGGRP